MNTINSFTISAYKLLQQVTLTIFSGAFENLHKFFFNHPHQLAYNIIQSNRTTAKNISSALSQVWNKGRPGNGNRVRDVFVCGRRDKSIA